VTTDATKLHRVERGDGSFKLVLAVCFYRCARPRR